MFLIRQKLPRMNRMMCTKVKKLICEFKSNSDLLNNYFGMPQNRVDDFIIKHKLSQIPTDSIFKVITYCENLGFSKDDIIKVPMLLRTPPSVVDQYYTVMVEGGFVNITPLAIAKYRTWCRKEIYELKKRRFINHNTNVAESFIQHLNPRPDEFHIKSYDDLQTWSDVHISVLSKYLKWRLQATSDDIKNLLTVHSGICRKSFKHLCQNIAFAEELNFSHDKILKYGYILRAYPKQTQEILEEFPELVGVSMKRAMRMYPKLITTSAPNIKAIYEILKKHNISDDAIYKRLNVFHLAPETVEYRLQELKRDADMKVLLNNPNILRLVVHHNRAKSRLQFLKQLQLKCASVSLLGNDDNKFDSHIKEGKDVNSFTDTLAYLKGIFKGADDYETALKRHPYYLQVPLTQMEETYQFLLDEKYTNTSICKVIYILLYPKEKIKNAFEQISQMDNYKMLTQVNILNLALYFIEKKHHFSGDGIWTKSESVEEGVQSF